MTRIGLVGLADLAPFLQAGGLDVVGHEASDMGHAVKDISESRKSPDGVVDAILVLDVAFVGGPLWVSRQAKAGPLAVIRGVGDAFAEHVDTPDIELPATLDEILAAVGQPAIEGGGALVFADVDGVIVDAGTASAPAPAAAASPAPEPKPEPEHQPESTTLPPTPEPEPEPEPTIEIPAAPDIPDPNAPLSVFHSPEAPAADDWTTADTLGDLPDDSDDAVWPTGSESPSGLPPIDDDVPHPAEFNTSPDFQGGGTARHVPVESGMPQRRAVEEPEPLPSIDEPAPLPPIPEAAPAPVAPPQPEVPPTPPPPAAEPAPAPLPAARSTSTEIDVFAEQTDPAVSSTVFDDGTRRGAVVYVGGGKGGIGKTAITLSLAQRAANGGLTSVALDMNRGQADFATRLRIKDGVPTIADAVFNGAGDVDSYVSTPDQLARAVAHTGSKATGSRATKAHIVFGPATPEHADPSFASAAVYRDVIEQLRRRFDLVVVDTQIAEAHDTSGLFTGVVLPMLAKNDAWFVGITSLESTSIVNLSRRITTWAKDKMAPKDRVMIVVSGVSEDKSAAQHKPELAAKVFQALGYMIGTIPENLLIKNSAVEGYIPAEYPEIAPALNAVLDRVTGDPVFAPEAAVATKPKGGIFGRLRKKP